MKTKREIGALDWAICSLMDAIDGTMALVDLVTWDYSLQYGLNVEITRDTEMIKMISIYPVGWPEDSYISCRFIRNASSWDPEEGVIFAFHVVGMVNQSLPFKYHRGNPSYILSSGSWLSEELKKAVTRRVGEDRASQMKKF